MASTDEKIVNVGRLDRFLTKCKALFANKSDAIKSISRSGTTFTATRADNTTFTFTQQDNNTWTAMGGATSSAAGTEGYVPAPPKDGYNTKYLRADGTWTVPPDNNTTYSSKTAASGGTDVSLVTTGEKYTWNNKLSSHQSVTDNNPTLAWGTKSKVATIGSTDINVTMPANPNSDTKNTAGSTDTSSKIFLIGATSQAANPQTYSHDTAYVGTDGCLYSGGTKVLTAHQDISGKKNTQSAVSDPTASGNSLTFIDSISQNAQGVITPTKKTVSVMQTASSSGNTTAGLVPSNGSMNQVLQGKGWSSMSTSAATSSGSNSDVASTLCVYETATALNATITKNEGAIAIVATGNTHAAIASGQYVYVKSHSSLSEGLYKATSAIAANGTLSTSNLSSVSNGLGGDVASLSDQIVSLNSKLSKFIHIEREIASDGAFSVGDVIEAAVYQYIINSNYIGCTASGIMVWATHSSYYINFLVQSNAAYGTIQNDSQMWYFIYRVGSGLTLKTITMSVG